MIEHTVYGQLPSMKNRRILKVIKGRIMSFKNPEAQRYVKDFLKQIPGNLQVRYDTPVRLTALIFYKTKRPDLDESLLMDCLESSSIITNDRLIWDKQILKYFDKHIPRITFYVEKLTNKEISKHEGVHYYT